MTFDACLFARSWSNYELLDSGGGMKLERFGSLVLARPETQALWDKMHPQKWKEADAVFTFKDKHGVWNAKKGTPDSWTASWGPAAFSLKLTHFKHIGIFPEQALNWEWLTARIQKMPEEPRILNLFGYTGIASIVSAASGAFVTHVDASKQSLDWANENARLSRVPPDRIRWIFDDALSFVKREVRRTARYDGIILDPPAFGRGAKGEVWKIEEDLPKLLALLKPLLSETAGSFFLMNGYAAGYSARSFGQAVENTFGSVRGDCGELCLPESDSTRAIPSGIYARFVR